MTTPPDEILDPIRDLVARGEEERALPALGEILKSRDRRLYRETVVHSARLKDLRDGERGGRIASDQVRVERNALRDAILALVDEVEDRARREPGFLDGASPPETKPAVKDPPVEPTPRRTRPARVFFSYSHRDETYKDELARHLSALRRAGDIETWDDRMITAGDEWRGEIDERLERADVILLLISSDFLASDYCWDVEMKRALERHQAGLARVIPVVLRPVVWQSTPFAELQALPKDARPVTEWSSRDAAFEDVARGIREAVL